MKLLGGFRAQKLGGDAARAREIARLRLSLMLAAGAGVLVTLVIGGIWQSNATSRLEARMSQLEQENRRLGEELGVARLALEMERATITGLERQLGEVNEKLKARQAELEFLKAQSVAKPPPPQRAPSRARRR